MKGNIVNMKKKKNIKILILLVSTLAWVSLLSACGNLADTEQKQRKDITVGNALFIR